MCILMFFVLLTLKNVSKRISYPFGKMENIELNVDFLMRKPFKQTKRMGINW